MNTGSAPQPGSGGMNGFQRVFGTGPRGTFYSMVLFILAVTWREDAGLPAVTGSDTLRYTVFTACSLVTLGLIVWSIRSLPVQNRGIELVTTGAFRYCRHPLYGAFVSCFNFGFAVLLNNWIYVLWALVMIPVWGWNVQREEDLMRGLFGKKWDRYCARTWRFFPRLPIGGWPGGQG